MKILKWLNSRFALYAQIVFWSGVNLILIGLACDLSKSDWASWIGAIGTVGALLGTLWIASSQARGTAKAERTRARLQAATMTVRLLHVSGDLRRACEKLHLDYPANPLAVFDVCDSILRSIDVWNVDDVMPLIPLPGGVACLLANAADSINALPRVLGIARDAGELLSEEGRAEFIDGFCKQINRVRKFVDQGYEGCQEAALLLLVET